jgi:hypothetical protein
MNNASEILFKTRQIGNLVDSLAIDGTVAGSPCQMIIDTGSNITIIRPDILRRCGEIPVRLEPVQGSVKTVTGERAPIKGKGKLTIQIGCTVTEHEIWVADVENECIVGLDFLIENACIVDVPRSCLQIQSEEIPLKRTGIKSSVPSSRRVVLAESREVERGDLVR